MGMISHRAKSACPWNLKEQNNTGHTDRLSICGGYYDGASDGDVRFVTNSEKKTSSCVTLLFRQLEAVQRPDATVIWELVEDRR